MSRHSDNSSEADIIIRPNFIKNKEGLDIQFGYDVYNFKWAVQQALDERLKEIAQKIKDVEDEQVNLRNMMKDVEIAKANPISQRFSDVVERYKELYNEAHDDFDLNEKLIQNDYDNTQLEVIDNFLKDTKTNTESIDKLKKDYGMVNGLVNSMLSDVDIMKNARNFNYVVRRMRLLTQKSKILQNLDDFTRIRMETADMIFNTQTMISAKKPITIYIPFWVVGMTDQNGSSVRQIMPIQEVGENQSTPQRGAPYAEHLMASRDFNFLDLIEDVKTPALAEQAKSISILDQKDKLIDIVQSDMAHNLDSGNMYMDSYFIWAMRNFINAPPPRINQIIQNIKQKEARK